MTEPLNASQVPAGERAGTDPREPLGRTVHQTRIAFEAERSALKDRPGFILAPWEERHPEQQELDMRIGHAVAVHALTENAITWGTTCTSCAKVLDDAYAETVRREEAEAKLAAIADECREAIDATAGQRVTLVSAAYILGMAESGSKEGSRDD